jgi:hypothetical protein
MKLSRARIEIDLVRIESISFTAIKRIRYLD